MSEHTRRYAEKMRADLEKYGIGAAMVAAAHREDGDEDKARQIEQEHAQFVADMEPAIQLLESIGEPRQ